VIRRGSFLLALGVCAYIVLATTTHAEEVKLPMTETRVIHSAIVGDDYRISIARPPEGTGGAEHRYPVVYLLDANGLFGIMAETVRLLVGGGEMPPAIVVGIGYPVATMAQTVAQRSRDFTPTADAPTEELLRILLKRDSRVVTGGGADFLRFIREELRPLIEKSYPADPSDATFVGNSLGGLFGLYVLLHAPESFQRYVIGSPPVLWDQRFLMRLEGQYAATHKDLHAHVYLVVGSLESDLSRTLGLPPELHAVEREFLRKVGNPDMVALFRGFAGQLQSRQYPGLELHSEVLEGESHASLPPIQISRGLRSVYDHLR
jgi:predicted alpha/beta superfamily hydrolase